MAATVHRVVSDGCTRGHKAVQPCLATLGREAAEPAVGDHGLLQDAFGLFGGAPTFRTR